MTFRIFLFALSIGSALAQIPSVISRPATENRFAPSISDVSGEAIQGGIFLDPTNPNVPKGEGLHLTESRFGHAFADYITPYSGYADSVLIPIWNTL